MTTKKTLAKTFYCRVCYGTYPISDKEHTINHYKDHMRFLEMLIEDIDIQMAMSENAYWG